MESENSEFENLDSENSEIEYPEFENLESRDCDFALDWVLNILELYSSGLATFDLSV